MIAKAPVPSELASDPPIRVKKNNLPKFLLAPATIALSFTMIPFFIAIFLSFTNYSIAKPTWEFVFLKNYVTMFKDPIFWEILGNTFLIAVIVFANAKPLSRCPCQSMPIFPLSRSFITS